MKKLETVARELQTCVALPAPREETATTFKELADEWTSGRLSRKYPDHVPHKKSHSDDASRLKRLFSSIGSIRLDQFTLEDAEVAMATLTEEFSPSTRRQYAQLIQRLLSLAVYPCKLIPSSPIPKGFKPKSNDKTAKAFLYPKEDALRDPRSSQRKVRELGPKSHWPRLLPDDQHLPPSSPHSAKTSHKSRHRFPRLRQPSTPSPLRRRRLLRKTSQTLRVRELKQPTSQTGEGGSR